jgi:hypothetical protein
MQQRERNVQGHERRWPEAQEGLLIVTHIS